ncbi:MAG: ATP-dependent DNA helicase [Zoogloeaceae bacterium]|jgi:ATP-dependent DNA helicase DinG|nr:ATP-dependent DNA helicase [Zoogloeaceae bacterium]
MSEISSAEIASLFAADGALAGAIPGYCFRPQQVEMAERIAAAIEACGVLVAEAGTGTGKTLAYLAPALLAGGKTIISTGTKTLQDQLFQRDLPAVRDALRVPATIALLKGRANYVCHYHLARAKEAGRFASREEAGHLLAIDRFARVTTTGDKAECVEAPEDSGAWPAATSTRDNCLGQECPNLKECFVMAARREAQAADVVVVNHHLFFADVMLRDTGVAELLPACNTVIFDEAHQLPETASLFFGESVSTAQLLELARDARLEGLAGAKDCLDLPEGARALEKAARDARLAVPGENARFAAAQLPPAFFAALDAVMAELTRFGALLESQAGRSEGLERCWRRARELAAVLERWRAVDDAGLVRWAEVFSQALALNATPLDIADIFRKQMEGHPRAWIFTSATLAVESDFSHYRAELGLTEADTGCWGSPFDYPNQALLYAPQAMPDPNSRDYNEAVADAAWPLIRASRGRAFVLCTSLRAMRRIHELLQARFIREDFDHPLLLQGEGAKSELLARFRRLGNAVLVASQSFWEGVDVRGEALSLVVIDKLPFAPPDDPVLAARIEHMKKAGRNAFMEYQLPRAVISIKQGAGRLIRDERDRGVLMLCDPRLITKPYGKRVWRSLPPMRRTRELDEALEFFALETA